MNKEQVEAIRSISSDDLIRRITRDKERHVTFPDTIHSQCLLTCDYCGATYLVNNVGELIGALGEYDIAPREIQFADYFYTGPSY